MVTAGAIMAGSRGPSPRPADLAPPVHHRLKTAAGFILVDGLRGQSSGYLKLSATRWQHRCLLGKRGGVRRQARLAAWLPHTHVGLLQANGRHGNCSRDVTVMYAGMEIMVGDYCAEK